MSEQSGACSLGLRARTALAIAVVLAKQRDGLRVVHRGELAIFDPELPDSRQPHHAALGLSGAEARRVVERAERAVARAALDRLAELRDELGARGLVVQSVGVVGSEADPSRVKSPHMHAHAAEGRLFREVLERAAREAALPVRSLGERHAWDEAGRALRRSRAELEGELRGLGKQVGAPWRAHEKLASLAAWVALGAKRGREALEPRL
jgi:hypothetical protein